MSWYGNDLLGPVKTPVLCAETPDDVCDNLDDLVHWPAKRHWVPDEQMQHGPRHIQAWLFFGILNILTQNLGETFALETYVAEDDVKIVKWSEVLDLLQRAKDILCTAETDNDDNDDTTQVLTAFGTTLFINLNDALDSLQPWVQYYLAWLSTNYSGYDVWSLSHFNACWSVFCLIERLAWIGYRSVDPRQREPMVRIRGPLRAFHLGNAILEESLRRSGRCPTIVNRDFVNNSIILQLLEVPIASTFNHELCSMAFCHAFNVISTKHWQDCADHSCCLIGINTQRLNDIISTGSIPIVRSTIGQDGLLKVDLVNASVTRNYVAISHVWAGGLGNPNDNEHHRCQLFQLHVDLCESRSRLNRTTQTVYYWLDTLCIPANNGELKTKAIDSMAAIYAGASKIHVIDPELILTKARDLDASCLRNILSCGPWMARSWTLHEGALAVDLQFKFRDMILPLSQLKVRRSDEHLSAALQALWKRDVDRLIRGQLTDVLQAGLKQMTSPIVESGRVVKAERKLSPAWNALAYRTTTQTDDVAAILAVYLDCSAGEVLKLPKTRRLLALLSTQTTLPLSILFSPIDTQSDFWCPLLPNFTTNSYLLDPRLGFFQFDNDGHARIPNVKATKLIFCYRQLDLSQETVIYEQTEELCHHLSFSKSRLSKLTTLQSDILLMFDSSTNQYGQGIVCQDLCDTPGGLHAKYVETFTYGRHHASYECLPGLLTTTTGSQVSRQIPQNHFSIANPIGPNYISSDHPLIIDIGAQAWPRLKWSRPEFYPFITVSLRVSRFLKLIIIISVGNMIYLLLYMVANAGVAIGFHVYSYIAIWVPFGIISIYCKYRLLDLDYRYVRGWAHELLQSNWANSFQSTIKQHRLLYRGPLGSLRHRRLTLLVYLAFWLVSTTLLVYLAIDYYHFSLDPGLPAWTWFVQSIFGFFMNGTLIGPPSPINNIIWGIVKPICITISVEMTARAFIVLYILLLQSRTNHSDTDPAARRVSYTIFFLDCFLLVIMLTILVISWSAFAFIGGISEYNTTILVFWGLWCLFWTAFVPILYISSLRHRAWRIFVKICDMIENMGHVVVKPIKTSVERLKENRRGFLAESSIFGSAA